VLDAMRAATAGQGMSSIFADPRSLSGQMPRVSSSGVVIVSPAGSDAKASRPVPQPDADERITESDAHDPRQRARQRRLMIIGGLAVLGIVGGGAIALAVRSPKPPVVTPPLVVEPPKVTPTLPTQPVKPPPAKVEVRFDVASEPAGATVSLGDAVLGTTPFSFSRERVGDAPLELELSFALDGYQPKAVVAHGKDGTVTVSETLVKKTPGKKPPKGPKKPPDHPPGYKDDPYQ
jgi:hypothetical protein